MTQVAHNTKQSRIYHPENVGRKLAIVVGHKLPEVALNAFPLFTVSGKVDVQLELMDEICGFGDELLHQILTFQTQVIPYVLESEVSWTEVDCESSDFLVIPVDQNGSLDRACLRAVLQLPTKPSKDFVFEVKFSSFLPQNLAKMYKKHRKRRF